jgi:hypothetical protein
LTLQKNDIEPASEHQRLSRAEALHRQTTMWIAAATHPTSSVMKMYGASELCMPIKA